LSSFNDTLQQFQPFLLTIAPVVVPVLLAYLTVLVRTAFDKMPSAQRATLESIVQTGVSAAEQTSFGKLTGDQKKDLALSAIHAQLDHYGLSVPDSVIEPMLEEAVLLLNIASGKNTKAVLTTKTPIDLTGTKEHA
jgi:hypothetical protein